MNHEGIINAIKVLQQQNKKYACFHKTELHMHTPASECYRLNSQLLLKDATLEQVLDLAIIEKLINPLQNSLLIEASVDKSEIIYELIANKLYELDVRIATVADHNTLDGYFRLNDALNRVRDKFNFKKHVDLFPGIEITCNDKTHIVGIFNYSKESIALVNRHLLSLDLDKNGTVRDPFFVIEVIKKARGLVYIAHYDTMDKSWSIKFEKLMFSTDNLDAICLSQCTNQKINFYKVKFAEELQKRKSNLSFIKDGDSHSIEEIGKNSIWVKCGNINFTNIRHAFEDRPTRLSMEQPNINFSTILGICVVPGVKGFLKTKKPDDEFLLIPFSSDLNAIIGGRGSGKTTILNLLEWCFSQQCKNSDEFYFLLQFDEIHVFLKINGKNYVLSLMPDKYWDGYTSNWSTNYSTVNKKSVARGKNINIRKWVSMRLISGKKLRLIQDHDTILRSVYKKIYSLSSIIHTVETGDFCKFIRDILHDKNDNKINNIVEKILSQEDKYFIANLDELKESIQKRIQYDDIIVNDLNLNADKKLILSRKSNNINLNNALVDGIPKVTGINSFYKSFLADIILTLIDKIDFLDLLREYYLENYDQLSTLIDWPVLVPEISTKKVEQEIDYSPTIALTKVQDIVFKILLADCLNAYIEDKIGNFQVEYNVNYKESGDNGKNFKSIMELSLGQKGIAIFSLILEMSKVLQDDTPLIVDQPEDHLDNLYIYKNLITDLRRIKNKKQIVLVTHNPSIIMAGDAEQVICLGSDGSNGWIDRQGASDNNNIVKFVIGLMEGAFL